MICGTSLYSGPLKRASATTRPLAGSKLSEWTCSNGLNADPPERLGWGNDGALLREFAAVAIVQHTRTLNS
jgi:hypothetical protein